ncbi:MAG TPA: bacillithiol system redox-active protein YtxJ [Balneolaceae bacterium]|nr:bacillithiol system redox-active protein YtxJ [Balneolaceae bacterium]
MAFFSSSDDTNSDAGEIWNKFAGKNELQTILAQSKERPQLIYKHSHRCSVCIMAKEEIESTAEAIKDWADLHFVNVINQRGISNHVASELDIRHESPQAIILQDGQVTWSGSHWEIKGKDIVDKLTKN